MLINKHKCVGSKHCNDPKFFIKYSNDMDDVYKNIDEYNSNKKRKIFIVFDDMVADTNVKEWDYSIFSGLPLANVFSLIHFRHIIVYNLTFRN